MSDKVLAVIPQPVGCGHCGFVRTRGKPELLEQAAASGKDFWFFDWMRHSKEQAGHFSFGFRLADYRYIYTLDRLIRDAESKKLAAPAVAAARKFRDQLRAELSLDLSRYYESRTASYAENWYPRADNPWTHGRFQAMRRQAAEHIIALQTATVR